MRFFIKRYRISVKWNKKELIPFPLCCRAFLSKESACKNVIICHENYGEGIEKQKFLSKLKSAVDVRVTNLNQVLLNELTEAEIVEKANEIIKRTPTSPENERKIPEIEQVEANHHVSQFCNVCLISKEAITPPILAEILFQNKTVEFPIQFTACGDGLELVELVGLTKGYCYKCEIQNIDPKSGNGRRFGRQPIILNGEASQFKKNSPQNAQKGK